MKRLIAPALLALFLLPLGAQTPRPATVSPAAATGTSTPAAVAASTQPGATPATSPWPLAVFLEPAPQWNAAAMTALLRSQLSQAGASWTVVDCELPRGENAASLIRPAAQRAGAKSILTGSLSVTADATMLQFRLEAVANALERKEFSLELSSGLRGLDGDAWLGLTAFLTEQVPLLVKADAERSAALAARAAAAAAAVSGQPLPQILSVIRISGPAGTRVSLNGADALVGSGRVWTAEQPINMPVLLRIQAPGCKPTQHGFLAQEAGHSFEAATDPLPAGAFELLTNGVWFTSFMYRLALVRGGLGLGFGVEDSHLLLMPPFVTQAGSWASRNTALFAQVSVPLLPPESHLGLEAALALHAVLRIDTPEAGFVFQLHPLSPLRLRAGFALSTPFPASKDLRFVFRWMPELMPGREPDAAAQAKFGAGADAYQTMLVLGGGDGFIALNPWVLAFGVELSHN